MVYCSTEDYKLSDISIKKVVEIQLCKPIVFRWTRIWLYRCSLFIQTKISSGAVSRHASEWTKFLIPFQTFCNEIFQVQNAKFETLNIVSPISIVTRVGIFEGHLCIKPHQHRFWIWIVQLASLDVNHRSIKNV